MAAGALPNLPPRQWSSSSTATAVLPADARHWLFFAVFFMASLSVLGFSAKAPNSKLPPSASETTVVIAYYKPPDVITSHSDENALAAVSKKSEVARRTCYEDIQSMNGCIEMNQHSSSSSWEQVTGIRSKLHAIGRLDCDTTGLLLLTNDGGLVHHVTNPSSKDHNQQKTKKALSKTYQALIMGCHDNHCDAFEKMRMEGVDIGPKYGGPTQPVDHLEVLDHPTAKSTLVSITISEGKNRQVRRMFHSMGSGVMKLKRTRIGTKLTLQGLEEGQWRIMSDTEVEDCLGWKVRPLSHKIIETSSSASFQKNKGNANNRKRILPKNKSPPRRRRKG